MRKSAFLLFPFSAESLDVTEAVMQAVMALFYALQQQLVGGLTAGSVKG